MDEKVILPITPDALDGMLGLLGRTDPPLTNCDSLVMKSVSLFNAVVTETTPPKKGALAYTLFSEQPKTYRRFDFPFWLDWKWEHEETGDEAKPASSGMTIELALPGVTRVQIREVIRKAPRLPTEGHVISSSLYLFGEFVNLAEPPEPKGKFFIHQPERNEMQHVKFPFWRDAA